MNMDASAKMQRRALERIPGMTQLYSKRPDLYSYGVWPAYYKQAKGAVVQDLDGRELLDFSIAAVGAAVLGYADDDVDRAVCAAVSAGVCSSLNCPEEVSLAERLCGLHPWADMARFTRGGGEAMAVAVRIARAATGRDGVAFCGYHGWHDWYLAANLRRETLEAHLMRGLDARGVPSVLRDTAFPFRYNHPEELEAILQERGGNIAAVVMEPMRGERPADGFLGKVRKMADDAGAVLIFDEISAGFRLRCGGAHMILDDARPDMAVFSKALGNGYAISAVIGHRAIMEQAQSSFISSTNWTERIGPCAALATIDKFERLRVHERLIALGERIKQGWLAAAAASGLRLTVGGMAPMAHFSFPDGDDAIRGAYFTQSMLDKGFLACNSYYAMYAHEDEMADRYLDACAEAFGEMARLGSGEAVLRNLKGRPATERFARLT